MRPRFLVAVLAALLLATGCVSAEQGQRQAESLDDGIQATGRVDGQRIAISSGNPDVVVGDCDPRDGLDDDLCIVGRTIDGTSVAFVVENPAILTPGARIPVRFEECGDEGCDEVAGHAVVELRLGQDTVVAEGGSLTVSAADERYTADFELRLGGADRLQGRFDVRPGAKG